MSCSVSARKIEKLLEIYSRPATDVTDSNDNPPVFNPGAYSLYVAENTAVGNTVQSVTATDDDAGSYGSLIYTIAGGNTGNVFRIETDGSVIGQIIIDQTLDYESITSYQLVVRATDGVGLTDDAVVTIQITGYNEHDPTFSPGSSSTEIISEDTAIDTLVIDLAATDNDHGDDGEIKYQIISGAASKFGINTLDGVVTVAGTLDRETTTSYAITVHAIDTGTIPGRKTGTYSLTVSITDINDEIPICTSTLYSASVSEDAANPTSVIQIDCPDADDDPNSINNDITYHITAGDTNGHFSIDISSGWVSTDNGLDRETVSSYSLTIEARDQGTNPQAYTSTTTLIILVTGKIVRDITCTIGGSTKHGKVLSGRFQCQYCIMHSPRPF